jgi:phenylacetate-coenzyme A ligase PaaK-like adenylate-forming protein
MQGFFYCLNLPVIHPEEIFNIQGKKDFRKLAMKTYRFQYENVMIYREFCDFLGRTPATVTSIEQVPFLPIQFFKSHTVLEKDAHSQEVFTSSGTTGQITSRHFVKDLSLYERSFRASFSRIYGNIEDYVILALLPSYLEREGSSLIYMVQDMINTSKNANSGFYLHNLPELVQTLKTLDDTGQNVLLIGVTYALLDLAELKPFHLQNTIVMETGGMKGRRREMVRQELHKQLIESFGTRSIHSEYGMTELLSQAYSTGNGLFECPPWMDVLVRDTEDALSLVETGRSGGLNIIDLANAYSCSFIATQDLGRRFDNGTFEVLGRFDHSDIRGCNLMVL